MAGEAVAALREAIIVGDLPPGSPLRLEELAASLGMSISPIREAIRHLETVGLAEHVAYRGARVTVLNVDDMLEVYEVRAALEVPAARRAAERFTDADELALVEILDDLEKAYRRKDRRAIVRGNTAFHTELARASGSRWVQRLLQPTFEATERYGAAVLQAGRPRETMAIEAEGHHEILDACRARDPEAAEQAARRHLEVFRHTFDTFLSELIRRDEWPPADADCRRAAASGSA
jgi:DNA-binding GntR family transcriptional regulator